MVHRLPHVYCQNLKHLAFGRGMVSMGQSATTKAAVMEMEGFVSINSTYLFKEQFSFIDVIQEDIK